jgi:hypothetical protein
MKKLYHLYNENFEITHAEFFNDGEHPENAVFVEGVNFIKPMFNPETNEVFEGATTEEIEQANKLVVPETITAIPFFVQLELMGITESDVINKIETLHQAEILNDQQRVEALVSVRRANTFERNHHFISLIANAFEISQEQVDTIFINGNL